MTVIKLGDATDTVKAGILKTKSIQCTDGIPKEAIAAGAGIEATKLQQQYSFVYQQLAGTDVVAATQNLHVAKAAGTIVGVQVRPETVPTGDYTINVDIQKAADGSGSFATVLSATEEISVSESSVNYTLQDASLGGTLTYAAGDCFQVIITVAGSSGAQGQGLTVDLILRQDPA